MDQDLQEDSHVNLLTLPIELLVYIISFLSSLHGRVTLRYVSRWLRCVVEETPSLWKEFSWPYYDSHEECNVKEMMKMCGQHVKVISFPYCRASSTLLEMLLYCSNVQHLSLPSTKLNPEQIIKIIHHMGCLQTLEIKVDHDTNIGQLFSNTSHLKEIMIISDSGSRFEDLFKNSSISGPRLFKYWIEAQCRPPSCNVIARGSTTSLAKYAAQINTTPTIATAKFKMFHKYNKVPLGFSPSLPFLQLHVEESGQVFIPCVKLSDLRLEDDLAVMTNYQYGEKTMYGVKVTINDPIMNLMNITKPCNLKCATHLDLSLCFSLHSGHLKQLAIACPNLQRLNLQDYYSSYVCLKSLQSLSIGGSRRHCQGGQGGQACNSVYSTMRIRMELKYTNYIHLHNFI